MQLSSDLIISQQEILDTLSPYLVRNVSSDDKEWSLKETSVTNKWIWYFIKSRLRRFLLGNSKKVSTVNKEYSQVWSTNQYPGQNDIASVNMLMWGDDRLEVYGWGEKRVHLFIFSKVIERLKPKRILEVGCGNGAMLMMLSVMQPDVEFTGVELTEAGINAAKKMQAADELPKEMIEFVPRAVVDRAAYKRVKFEKGNALSLPFPDDSFDLVNTSLALEQMNAIQNQAITEIARVSNGYVAMIEPFPDFNKTPLRRLYTKTRDYFSVPVNQLPLFSLNPVAITGDFPSKIFRGVGFVLSSKVK